MAGTVRQSQYANVAQKAINADSALKADTATSASYAVTASLLLGSVQSASYAATASLLLGSIQSASYAATASVLLGSIQSASYAATASILLGSIQSASYAATASYIVTAQTASYYGGSVTSASYAKTASYVVTANTASYYGGSVTSASYASTASYTPNYVLNSTTSSFVLNSQTGSFVQNSQTSSFVQNSQTSSFVLNSQTSSMTVATASYYGGSVISASYAATSSYSKTLGASIANDGATGLLKLVSSAGTTISSIDALTASLANTASYVIPYEGAWRSYSVAWTTDGATQPVIGNGSVTGYYKQVGKTTFVRVKLNAGTTTTFGVGAFQFSLPISASSPDGIQFPCSILDNGVHWYQGTVNGTYTGATNKSAIIYPNISGWSDAVTSTAPFTWGSTDSLQFNGSYESI